MPDISLIVTGKVQGVYYRKFIREMADLLGLDGFVENRPDGSVYIEISGDENKVSSLIDHCRIGPPQSIVLNVDIHPISHAHTGGFYIKRN